MKQWIGGINTVKQALLEGIIEKIDAQEGKQSKNLQKLLQEASAQNIPINYQPYYALDLLLPDVKHQGIAALCRIEKNITHWEEAIAGKENPLLLILDSLQDPHNLGACLRSALAFNVDAVLIPKHRSAEITATVRKVACGAAESLNIFQVSNLKREVEKMKAKGIWIIAAASESANSVYEQKLPLKLALIVGNEGDGIRHGLKTTSDQQLKIPINPKMESLNVSVACAILLAEITRQRNASL